MACRGSSTAFFADRPVAECSAVVLHETLHKVFKHCTRHRDYWKDDSDLASQAADYVVNDVIHNLKDKLCAVYLMVRCLMIGSVAGHSLRSTIFYVKKRKNGGRGRSVTPLDTHEPNEEMGEVEIQQVSKDIDDEIKQAGL